MLGIHTNLDISKNKLEYKLKLERLASTLSKFLLKGFINMKQKDFVFLCQNFWSALTVVMALLKMTKSN